MDIPPYASSNAISREQYALVRKVELASASNIADGYILAELDVLKRRLATGFSISNVSTYQRGITSFVSHFDHLTLETMQRNITPPSVLCEIHIPCKCSLHRLLFRFRSCSESG
jgi:hypothetical protein